MRLILGSHTAVGVADPSTGTVLVRHELVNPTFVAVAPDRRHLYAVSEDPNGPGRLLIIDSTADDGLDGDRPGDDRGDPDDGDIGGARSGDRPDDDALDGVLRDGGPRDTRGRVGGVPSGGARDAPAQVGDPPCPTAGDGRAESRLTGGDGPCHVSVHPGGEHLLVSHYVSGSLAVLSTTGGEVSCVVRHCGGGPDPDRQATAHVHQAVTDPSGQWILACDLGTDEVIVYRLDDNQLRHHHRAAFRPGQGVRHLAFAPDGRHVYVTAELTSQLVTCAWDEHTGVLSPGESIDTTTQPPSAATREVSTHRPSSTGSADPAPRPPSAARDDSSGGRGGPDVADRPAGPEDTAARWPSSGSGDSAVSSVDSAVGSSIEPAGSAARWPPAGAHGEAAHRSSAVPPGPADDRVRNYPGAVVVSRTGEYVYVTNRGDDSIAVVDTRTHTLIATVDCGGRWPRDACLSPDGRWLFVANEHSGTVTTFDVSNGIPAPTGSVIDFPGATSVTPQ